MLLKATGDLWSNHRNLKPLLLFPVRFSQCYDGDTPQSDRSDIRSRCRILITNPDMIHVSLLPCHSQFKALLSHLAYVVLDEVSMLISVKRSSAVSRGLTPDRRHIHTTVHLAPTRPWSSDD